MPMLDDIFMTNIKCSSTSFEIKILSEAKDPYATQSVLFHKSKMFCLV